jgi:hypothetical protein
VKHKQRAALRHATSDSRLSFFEAFFSSVAFHFSSKTTSGEWWEQKLEIESNVRTI